MFSIRKSYRAINNGKESNRISKERTIGVSKSISLLRLAIHVGIGLAKDDAGNGEVVQIYVRISCIRVGVVVFEA